MWGWGWEEGGGGSRTGGFVSTTTHVVIKGPTFAQSTAQGTIFRDAGIPIFGHDLVGAVEILEISTAIELFNYEIRVVLAHIWIIK
jgi:hypothetical protein